MSETDDTRCKLRTLLLAVIKTAMTDLARQPLKRYNPILQYWLLISPSSKTPIDHNRRALGMHIKDINDLACAVGLPELLRGLEAETSACEMRLEQLLETQAGSIEPGLLQVYSPVERRYCIVQRNPESLVANLKRLLDEIVQLDFGERHASVLGESRALLRTTEKKAGAGPGKGLTMTAVWKLAQKRGVGGEWRRTTYINRMKDAVAEGVITPPFDDSTVAVMSEYLSTHPPREYYPNGREPA
ncbi:MAG TPA: hypothetical protein PKL84_08525 [Candidatus Hydrogenedentes bacterium]|nr:hypothetical protein [Candidatus Hydrogenedentota bacterium]